jgi:hypothetical protein
VVAAALTVALLDAAFGIVQCHISNSSCTATAFFRGIASFAPSWFPGYRTSSLGALLHLSVASFWSSAYALTYQRFRPLRQISSTRAGLTGTAIALGCVVWLAMDLLVLPAIGGGRHTPVGSRTFWIILAGHPLFVGLPITAIVRRPTSKDA